MMQGGNTQFYSSDEDPSTQHPPYNGNRMTRNGEDPELRACHRTITQLEERCVRLESFSQDLEKRLEQEALKRVQMEGDMVIRERQWEEKLKEVHREKQELQVQFRKAERQAKAFQKDSVRTLSELHNYHKAKHDMIAKAKREAVEELREQERVEREMRNGMSNGNGQSATGASTPAGQPVRRMASSGTLFAKTVPGRAVGNPRSVEPSGIRDSCVNNALADFFNLGT